MGRVCSGVLDTCGGGSLQGGLWCSDNYSGEVIMPRPPIRLTPYWENLPPTPRQTLAIARLCMILRIKPELESLPMTRRRARDLIYELRWELREARGRSARP